MSSAPEVASPTVAPRPLVDTIPPADAERRVDRTAPPTKVTVVGTGYVGLTCGVCLAQLGFDVTCADIDADKIDALEAGRVPIHEPGCEELVARGRAAKRLAFRLGTESAVADADIVLLCVPTPQGADGSADISYLLDAAETIGPHLRPGAAVVNKSTVPVGAAGAVAQHLGRDDVDVVSNPEFLREGSAIDDFLRPDRVVIGADDPSTAEWVAHLYDGLDTDVLITSTGAAETIKYVANGFLAMKVSFANAVAGLCEAVGADVFDVLRGIGSDHRIGHEFLQPGPGWGGSCFPKDSRALVSIGDAHGYDFEMMRVAIAVNQQQRHRIVAKVRDAVGRSSDDPRRLEGIRVGVLGLSFKAHTDDLRESPSVAIVGELRRRGADVIAYDPTTCRELGDAQRLHLGDLPLACDPEEVARGADVVLVLTEWPEFRFLLDDDFAAAMRGDVVVDARNLLDPTDVAAAGLRYIGVGR
jgi:UDPglucose 6-dehydrogenase